LYKELAFTSTPDAAVATPGLYSCKRSRPSARGRILLVEDDHEIAEELSTELFHLSYDVTHVATGTQGAVEARHAGYDLLILDVLLPERDGLSIIRELRAEGIRTPVLVVSALNGVNDRVRGLKTGADDYVAKPFALAEIAARVEALLRRPVETRATILRVGPLELDLIERVARRNEREIALSKSEFKLLTYFMRRPDRVVTRDMVLADVWDYRVTPQTNLVDVHIGQLRRKLDSAGGKPMLLSVRGVGFILRDPG
jgi:two-component system OmpR family response regulator